MKTNIHEFIFKIEPNSLKPIVSEAITNMQKNKIEGNSYIAGTANYEKSEKNQTTINSNSNVSSSPSDNKTEKKKARVMTAILILVIIVTIILLVIYIANGNNPFDPANRTTMALGCFGFVFFIICLWVIGIAWGA